MRSASDSLFQWPPVVLQEKITKKSENLILKQPPSKTLLEIHNEYFYHVCHKKPVAFVSRIIIRKELISSCVSALLIGQYLLMSHVGYRGMIGSGMTSYAPWDPHNTEANSRFPGLTSLISCGRRLVPLKRMVPRSQTPEVLLRLLDLWRWRGRIFHSRVETEPGRGQWSLSISSQ